MWRFLQIVAGVWLLEKGGYIRYTRYTRCTKSIKKYKTDGKYLNQYNFHNKTRKQ